MEYPNFSHGTAGIGYFLAALFAATRDECFLVRAFAAGAYLQSIISKPPSSSCLVPHDQTNGRSLFYLGWCHGPAGTGRFFFRLSQLTGEPAWLDLVDQQAVTLQNSGIPEQQTFGYWNNVSRCCGAAGVSEFFLGLYTATKEKAYLTFAQRIAVHLISRAEKVEDVMKWTQSENRLHPDNLLAQTGLMQGAAGIGLFLVHVAQISRHQKPSFNFQTTRGGKTSKRDRDFLNPLDRKLLPRDCALFFQELVDVALVDNVGTGVDNRWHLFASREVVHRVYHFYPNFVGTLADQYATVSFLQEAQLLRQSVERNDY